VEVFFVLYMGGDVIAAAAADGGPQSTTVGCMFRHDGK